MSFHSEKIKFEIRAFAALQLAAVPRPMLTGGRGHFSVFSQAVTTTAEMEAEAETGIVAKTTIPESTELAPPATTKTKKLTKRVKHIMEVSRARIVEHRGSGDHYMN